MGEVSQALGARKRPELWTLWLGPAARLPGWREETQGALGAALQCQRKPPLPASLTDWNRGRWGRTGALLRCGAAAYRRGLPTLSGLFPLAQHFGAGSPAPFPCCQHLSRQAPPCVVGTGPSLTGFCLSYRLPHLPMHTEAWPGCPPPPEASDWAERGPRTSQDPLASTFGITSVMQRKAVSFSLGGRRE